MEVFYYKAPRFNFGDDLNAVLWPRLFTKEMYAVDDVTLIGIGSILTEEWVGRFSNSGRRVIVLGSGTSYDVPPLAIHDWTVLAVRGPWTACVIGMPEKAITDGAILLAATPDLVPQARLRTDVIFMPHHRSIQLTPWSEIAEEAGLKFVSPQRPVGEVLAAFAKAKLVVTEAMHGAIVADTLRIPWIPVVTAPVIDEFKWRDWTLSMELPFEPVRIATGHAIDHRRDASRARILRRMGISGHRVLANARSREELRDYLMRRFSPETKKALLNVKPGPIGRRFERLLKITNSVHRHRAIQSLRSAAAGPSYLSSDRIFSQRLNQMVDVVRVAERIVLSRS